MTIVRGVSAWRKNRCSPRAAAWSVCAMAAGFESEIQEAGPGDLDAVAPRAHVEAGQHLGRELTRVQLSLLGQRHERGGLVIAELRIRTGPNAEGGGGGVGQDGGDGEAQTLFEFEVQHGVGWFRVRSWDWGHRVIPTRYDQARRANRCRGGRLAASFPGLSLDDLVHGLGIGSHFERLAKLLSVQQFGDLGQGVQVFLELALRHQEKHHQIHRLVVQGIEAIPRVDRPKAPTTS